MNPTLLQKIIETNPQLHGWAELDKAITLASIVVAYKPKTIVEIGVWGGRSLIPMALACKAVGKGTVIGIDPWSPVVSAQGQVSEQDKQWWGDKNHEMVYQHFASFVSKLGLEAWTSIRRMKSDDFKESLEIGLLHIDGNHGPQAIADTEHFCPMIPVNGICILDDLHWHGDSVLTSEKWLLEHGFIKLFPLGTGAVYFRKS